MSPINGARSEGEQSVTGQMLAANLPDLHDLLSAITPLEMALLLAGAGISVMPQGVPPSVLEELDFTQPTTDSAKICQAWEAYPEARVVVAAQIASNLYAACKDKLAAVRSDNRANEAKASIGPHLGHSGGNGGIGGKNLDAGNQDWASLVPLENADLPRLTPDMLGGPLGEFAAALSASTETPFELTASLALGAASTAAARRIRVRVKPDYFEPANVWVLPSLAPGNRKSAVEKAAARPLREWEHDQAEAMKPKIASVTAEAEVFEARAKEKKKAATKADTDAEARDLAQQAADILSAVPEIPKPPQLWTSDATPENLGVLLAIHGERMAWLSAEAGFFEIVGGRYSKGVPNLDLMLKAHAGDTERVDRIGRPSVHLSEPLLTVAMSPQPELLRGLMAKPGFRGRGLLGRFLYFLPRSPLGYRTHETDPMPEAVIAAYGDRVRAMLDWPEATDANGEPCLHIVKLSPGAYDEWHAFQKRIEIMMRPGGDFEHVTDWVGKAPGAAVRVAGVLHAVDHAFGRPWEVEIPRETMERALAIVSVSAAHTLAVFRLMAADNGLAAAEAMWRWIQRRRARTFRARDAWQGLKGSALFSKMDDVTAALERLAERGYIAICGDGGSGGNKPGRPASPTVIVRPELSEGWE